MIDESAGLTGMIAPVGVLASIDPGTIFLAILLIFGAVVAGAFLRARSNAMNAMLHRVASRLGGTFVAGGWIDQPGVTFATAGRGARLEFFGGTKHSSPYSRVVVDMRGVSPGSLHILEQGFFQAFLHLFGAQDLEIGDPAFDKDYVIKATPSSLARQVFSPDRRLEGMRIVRRLRSTVEPTFNLDSQSVTVMVRQYIRVESDLMALIDAARDFVGFLVQPPAAVGIVLEEVRVSGAAACPVCGTSMSQGFVRCESCKTPHHAECWKYMGRCSTYACKGSRTTA